MHTINVLAKLRTVILKLLEDQSDEEASFCSEHLPAFEPVYVRTGLTPLVEELFHCKFSTKVDYIHMKSQFEKFTKYAVALMNQSVLNRQVKD